MIFRRSTVHQLKKTVCFQAKNKKRSRLLRFSGAAPDQTKTDWIRIM